MPAPAKTGRDQIVAAGRQLLEEGGADAVTMQAVAHRVGVRAPSLYKHVRDRRKLLEEVAAATIAELTARSEAVGDDTDPCASIVSLMNGLRCFALQWPNGYALAFGAVPGVPRPSLDATERSARLLLKATSALLGAGTALEGARLVTAWANGFITMELAGAFRMGGDIDAAWDWGLRRVVAAIDDREAS